MIGRLKDLARGFDGSQILTLSLRADFREAFDNMRDKDVTIEIKPFRKQRSLDANAFAWALIEKLAAKMNRKKTDIYLEELKDLPGISGEVEVDSNFADAYMDAWRRGHIGRDARVIWMDLDSGKTTVQVRLGSSDLDTEQMSRFISILIQDCEALGIPTLQGDEVNKMLGEWDKKYKKSMAESC